MFSVFPAWLAYGGAVALAAGLFLLQRLRVQPRVVVLPAAVLWRLAASQARPRALGGRFHDLAAYLLSLAVLLALWFAAAGVTFPSAPVDSRHVFYLDNSVLMTPADRLAQARQALLADVARVPAAQREVVLGEAVGVRLLAPGESVALLEARLKAVTAQVRPSSFASWAAHGLARDGAGPATLHYYGAWPAAAPLAARRVEGLRLDWGYVAPAVAGNRGIVSLGARPARSGQWGCVDVVVGTVASDGAAPDLAALTFTLEGQPFVATAAESMNGATWLLRDVPAEGRTLHVALRQGDAFVADDAASLVLPLRQRVAVAVDADVPAAVAEVVRRDPSLQWTDEANAQVVVRGASATGDAGKPTLRLVAAQDHPGAFRIMVPGPMDPDAEVDAAGLGLAGLDAGALADRLDRGIGIELAQGPRREVAVWRELFSEGSGFTRSAAMPVFLSRSLHWLAAPPRWAGHARAGHALALASGDDELRVGGAAEVALYQAQAGSAALDGRPVAVSLLDAGQSLAATQAAPAGVTRSPDETGSLAAWTRWLTELLLVLAALLLLLEWRLYQRGRMP